VNGDYTAGATWALYKHSWLPCRVLDEDPRTGTLEVRVTDRAGVHEVWLRREHVRWHEGPPSQASAGETSTAS
jgi:hypothetical protein